MKEFREEREITTQKEEQAIQIDRVFLSMINRRAMCHRGRGQCPIEMAVALNQHKLSSSVPT
jgi:hypothetical protein